MKKYEKQTRPASTFDALVETKCDLCDKTTKNDWRENSYDATETEVRLKTGANYPADGDGDETTVDICPTCFVQKLIPWVKSHGGTPTVKRWEW
jgi:hypothetical protein